MKHKLTKGLGTVSLGVWLGCLAVPLAAQSYDDDDQSEGDWDIFVGAGAHYAPEYEGSDKYKTEALPGLQIVWRNRLMIGPDGLGAFIVNNDRLRVSAAVGYGGGRKEKDSVYLKGLGDIDDGAVLALGAQYDLSRRFAATADIRRFLNGSEGTLVSLGIQSQVPFGVVRGALLPTGRPYDEVADERGLAIVGGISVDWADENYNQAFFGVNAAQSAASGLGQYTAGAGVKSVNVDLGFTKPLGDNWGITGGATYSVLLGDAADSPVVRKDNSLSFELFVGYKF